MIDKIKGIINEFLLHYTLLFLSVKGETGSGKTQLNRAFQKVYFRRNGYQSMIYLHKIPTGLIENLYIAVFSAAGMPFFKECSENNLREKMRSVLINDQVKAIVDDVIQNVLNGKKSNSTTTKIIFLSTTLLDMPTIMGRRSKILELQTA